MSENQLLTILGRTVWSLLDGSVAVLCVSFLFLGKNIYYIYSIWVKVQGEMSRCPNIGHWYQGMNTETKPESFMKHVLGTVFLNM